MGSLIRDDVFALHRLKDVVAALDQRIGTGKESDIYLVGCHTPTPTNTSTDWVECISKHSQEVIPSFAPAATRPIHASLKVPFGEQGRQFYADTLYQDPKPFTCNRHVAAMSLVRYVPLYQVHKQPYARPSTNKLGWGH